MPHPAGEPLECGPSLMFEADSVPQAMPLNLYCAWKPPGDLEKMQVLT